MDYRSWFFHGGKWEYGNGLLKSCLVKLKDDMNVLGQEAVAAKSSFIAAPTGLFQRKCACGGAAGMTGECETCKSKKFLGKPLQTKLRINEPGDQYELEADRVADQVMRMTEGGSIEPLRPSIHAGEGAVGRMPLLQRAEESNGTSATEGDKTKEEGSRCPNWRGDPQSISKRAGEFYARNHLIPPSPATVERIECEPPRPNGNYGCFVHFSDGLVLRVIVRETDIVVGTGPGPITTEHPPPATPLCFYEYSCPDGDLVLTVKKCQSSKPSGSSGPPAVAQRAALSGARGSMTAPPMVHEVLNSPGQPLDAATRAFFEPRFGHDFGRVRVHVDERAAQSARSVQAAAYTVGQDVVFGASQYAPYDSKGRRLLAHELAHTIQQGHARPLSQSDSMNGTITANHVPMVEMVQRTASPVLQRTQCNFYIHDSTEPTKLGWLWERSAVALALGASGGYAIASGDSIEEMLLRILSVYAEEDCDCTEEIQFLSHGSSGNAMYISKTGDEFTIKDFQIPDLEKYGDGPRSAPGYRAWYDGLTLRQRRLVVLRRTICGSDAEVYFRSCEAFQGKKGQEFAKASADFWRSKVIGHTKVIGLTQPGKKVLKSGKNPDWSETEGVGGTNPKFSNKSATTKPEKD